MARIRTQIKDFIFYTAEKVERMVGPPPYDPLGLRQLEAGFQTTSQRSPLTHCMMDGKLMQFLENKNFPLHPSPRRRQKEENYKLKRTFQLILNIFFLIQFEH